MVQAKALLVIRRTVRCARRSDARAICSMIAGVRPSPFSELSPLAVIVLSNYVICRLSALPVSTAN